LRQNNISTLAYSLAQGLLIVKFERGHQSDPVDNRAKKQFGRELRERAQQALEKLRPIASRHHTSLGNLAIAWLIAQPQNLQRSWCEKCST